MARARRFDRRSCAASSVLSGWPTSQRFRIMSHYALTICEEREWSRAMSCSSMLNSDIGSVTWTPHERAAF